MILSLGRRADEIGTVLFQRCESSIEFLNLDALSGCAPSGRKLDMYFFKFSISMCVSNRLLGVATADSRFASFTSFFGRVSQLVTEFAMRKVTAKNNSPFHVFDRSVARGSMWFEERFGQGAKNETLS